MKKKLVFVCAIVTAALLCACGPKVKMEDAKGIAAKDAGQEISSIEFTSESVNTVNGVTTYEFTFGNDIGEWSYTLDGDGNITASSETIYAQETEAQYETEAVEEATEGAVAEAVAEEEPEEELMIPPLQLAKAGKADENPSFDPFNVFENFGVDQADVIKEIVDNGYAQYYDKDSSDLYVYSAGLNSTYTDSDGSYTQIWTDKGEYTPKLFRYLERYYSRPDQFAEDFKYLEIALENQFGEPISAAYIGSDGNVAGEGTAEDYVEGIKDITDTDGGYVCLTYDSGTPKVSLNAEYDAADDMYTIYIDFE